MNEEYRKFKNEDIEALVELMAQLGYEHTSDSLLKNVNSVRRVGGEIFVCDVAGTVCGCASAILDVRLAAGVNGEIVSVVVSEQYRGKGLGKGLILHAESWLSERVFSIRIRANTVREDAHGFYKGMGYSLSKTQAVFEKNI